MGRRELQIFITSAKQVVTVRLVGEANFDFDASDQYIKKILDHEPKLVIVDASELVFISSVGMNFLINLRRKLAAKGGAIKVAALQPPVHKAMENAQLLKLFEVCDDVAGAVAKDEK